jgi:hypothetical protein
MMERWILEIFVNETGKTFIPNSWNTPHTHRIHPEGGEYRIQNVSGLYCTQPIKILPPLKKQKKQKKIWRKNCNEKIVGTVWESVFTDAVNSRVVIFFFQRPSKDQQHTTLPTIKTIYNCIQSVSKREKESKIVKKRGVVDIPDNLALIQRNKRQRQFFFLLSFGFFLTSLAVFLSF